ncbi:protein FAR-RED IMPAIRED RESPONSE 1-like [Bidens hawaiensis]|uniref:protein FAR-RED IMPAIRED RESPONSE 1-like n=1 Tax=Bidens hawaiensis TaxID=980011 RepID=UPI00404AB001
MVVQRLSGKKNCCDGYSFEYTVNSNGELDRLFWADEISKKNYLAFGDIISFDVTFKTNKYNMVFVPFTAIDNHCRNVTVGATLLSSESIESYSWLLQVFLDSFGIAPKVVVTDQDAAMKQAISLVLPNSRHRLCMRHIMKKLADKVGATLCNNENFKRNVCDIVWTDAISQSEFEMQWELIMKEYDLETNKWLCDMFEMRYDWIPAYYMDEPLSVLMRTTSRSETENHFFCQVSNSQLSLVELFSHFDHCMEIQRHNGRKNDHDTRSGVAYLKSNAEEDFVRFSVFDFNAYIPGSLEVLFKKEELQDFQRNTWLIVGRDVGVNPRTAPISTFDNDKNSKLKGISREITLAGEYLINSYATDVDELIKVRDQMNIMIKQADETRYKRTHLSKRDRFAAILGYDQPSEVTVRVPSGIKNKGCGSHKWIKSQKEIAISRSGKKYKECKVCHKQCHNIRTCPELQE